VTEKNVYADIEALLYPGYITETVVVDGITMSFRSAYLSDLFLLRTRIPVCVSPRDWKLLAVSNAVWEVDGHIIESGDTGSRRRIADLFQKVSAPVLDTLYAAVTTIRARVEQAALVFEAYCYEPTSRSSWRTFNRRCPSTHAPSWVSGSGSNTIQRLWVSYNLLEDDRIQWENDWYAATTVTATMAHKWVQQIRTEESNRWKTELERRNAVIQKATNPEKVIPEEDEQIKVTRLRTNEDLIEQMKRWQRGEYDDHDRLVQDYKNNIQQRHENMRIAHERRMASLDEALESLPEGAPSVVGYTAEQIAELGLENGGSRKTSKVYDASHPGRLYDKYLAKDIPIGGLRPDGKGGEMDVERPPISEALQGRRVTMPVAGGG
jgi:hypothetical protein